MIAAVILVSATHAQWQSYERTVARIERDTRNVAWLLAEHAGQTFGGIEETLRAVGRLHRDVARGIYRSHASVYVHLNNLRSGSPVLAEVGWFDAYGERVATSAEYGPAQVSVAGQELFRVPQEDPAADVHVSASGRPAGNSQSRLIDVSLRLEDIDGSFAGVASGTVDPRAFDDLFRSLELDAGYSITLLRRDGTVLAHTPSGEMAAGDRWPDDAVFEAHRRQGERGTYSSGGSIYGGGLASFAVVPRSGDRLLVDVGVARSAAFQEFRRDLALDALQTILGLTVLLVGARLLVLGLRRREELQAALTETTAHARMARAEAESANRAKSDFLARMSHELRTPLNAVLGFGQMIELDRTHPLSERQKEYCGYILQSGQHLLELINEVLDFAGVEAGRLNLSAERIDTSEALRNVARIMLPVAAKADVTLEVADAADAPDIWADTLRLRQVLINLVANAIKYNRPGGRVTIMATALPGGRVRVAVADTGVGIPPDRQANLFEPFERLGAERTAVEGTGLGLALSKRLVEAMDGSIGFVSDTDSGSTFWFDLPTDAARQTARREPAEAAAPAAATVAPGPFTLLYIEDNRTSCG